MSIILKGYGTEQKIITKGYFQSSSVSAIISVSSIYASAFAIIPTVEIQDRDRIFIINGFPKPQSVETESPKIIALNGQLFYKTNIPNYFINIRK